MCLELENITRMMAELLPSNPLVCDPPTLVYQVANALQLLLVMIWYLVPQIQLSYPSWAPRLSIR